ncbi:MAG: hypothetical protein M3376_12435 [Actinomycetota bacterium]|nr:hypothetical protein [Actinomycetota bacterium]
MATQIITINPDTIRSWAQERDGEPMRKRGTGQSTMDPAILDMAFAGAEDPSLEPLGWEEWLAELDEQALAAILQGEGADSTIKVVRRDKVVMTGE